MVKSLLEDQIWQIAMYDAYRGTGGFASGNYLIKNTREGDDKFEYRQAIAPYDNNFRTIVDANINPVFNKVNRTYEGSGKEFTSMFQKDCTGKGISYADWLSHTGNEAHRYGYVITFFGVDVQPLLYDDAVQYRTYPKLHKILPLQMTEVVTDEDGDVIEFTYSRNMYEDDAREYLTYKRGIIYDSNNTPIYMLSRMPKIYSFEDVDKRSVLPISTHVPLLTQTITKYNLDSLIEFQNSQCTFPLFRTDDSSFSPENISMGEDTIIKTKQGTSFDAFATEYVADKIRAESEAITKSMYTTYKLLTLYVGGANSSGEAISQLDNLRREELITKSTIASRFDVEVMRDFQELIGVSNYEYTVDYPTDFNVSSLTSYMLQAQSAINLGVAPENAIHIKTDIMNKYFNNATEEQRAEFLKNEMNNMEYGIVEDDA